MSFILIIKLRIEYYSILFLTFILKYVLIFIEFFRGGKNMISEKCKEVFGLPSCGPIYSGKVESLFINGISFYLGKTLTIKSYNVQNMNSGEDVWIIKLRDPKKYRKFILVSNREYVAWVSIKQIEEEGKNKKIIIK